MTAENDKAAAQEDQMKRVLMTMTAMLVLSGTNAWATNCDPAEVGCVNPALTSSCDQMGKQAMIEAPKAKPHGEKASEEKPAITSNLKNHK
jgi:hypothetical protein